MHLRMRIGMGRGLFFAREDKTYLIGTYQCVTYLRDIINSYS